MRPEMGGFEPNKESHHITPPVLSAEYRPSPEQLLDPQNYLKALKQGREYLGDVLRAAGF